jgi:cyclic beta-1,2-glucan synthetase
LRLQSVRELIRNFLPWRLPEFRKLQKDLFEESRDLDTPLLQLPETLDAIQHRASDTLRFRRNGEDKLREQLLVLLAQAQKNADNLIADIREASRQAEDAANSMDFECLLDKQRLLLSIGYDAQSEELQPYYYSLLATEPRTAIFVAIAKNDIPQESWFRLDRPLARDHGHPVMLSWTGTMFEYLMPAIWMRSYPNTLLYRASVEAVRSQREYAEGKGLPWGISESACAKRNDAGDYHYEAFGVPQLALRQNGSDRLVVSPYSTLLALNVDPRNALRNLHKMYSLGWFGNYGFYESSDFTNSKREFGSHHPEIVKCWMAHHMGMSLLSLANFLYGNIVQRWFHSDRRIQAMELLLQEKPTFDAA